jgi:hypothetical protein
MIKEIQCNQLKYFSHSLYIENIIQYILIYFAFLYYMDHIQFASKFVELFKYYQ